MIINPIIVDFILVIALVPVWLIGLCFFLASLRAEKWQVGLITIGTFIVMIQSIMMGVLVISLGMSNNVSHMFSDYQIQWLAFIAAVTILPAIICAVMSMQFAKDCGPQAWSNKEDYSEGYRHYMKAAKQYTIAAFGFSIVALIVIYCFVP